MKFVETPIPGCFLITPVLKKDKRGYFVKTFHDLEFRSNGIESDWQESFYTVSRKNVLRGLHFQAPPHDHAKLVTCLSGEIFDVIVDLRRNSPSYGLTYSAKLNEKNHRMLFAPKGVAHGFLALSSEALVYYNVTSRHSPEHDMGIHWKSVNVHWPTSKPIVSDRDSRFPPLDTFISPFDRTIS